MVAKKKIKKKIEHSPTLKTIRMVEDTLKNMDESAISISNLKKLLPKKVNHNTLKEILRYLEDCNKIIVGINGITWGINNSPKLKKAIDNALTFEEILEMFRKNSS